MLSFLRRLTESKVGVIVTFVALIVIALAFAAGGVMRLGGGTGGGGGSLKQTTAVKVGKTVISTDDLKAAVQSAMNNYRQQNPQLTMAEFIQGGGFDGTVEQMINSAALAQYGAAQGMAVSKKSIDGQIASFPGLQGVDGKFDPNLYKQVLAEQHLTDAGLHEEIAQDTFGQMLTTPTVGATQVPANLAEPYASLLLEQRTGEFGFVPAKAMPAGPAPTDQELASFYQHHIDQYTLPERRIIRYAEVTPDSLKAQTTPTEAEIAQAYKAQAERFQPTEKRTIEQVIIADQKAAEALAAKVKAGTPIAAAAKAAGLEAQTINSVTKDALTKQSSADVANAVFAAKQGDVLGPLKAPLGYAVIHVDTVAEVPGQTLAQAHDTLAKEIAAQKANDVLGKLHDTMDDAINGGSSFDDVVHNQHLTAEQTPAVTAQGVDPTDPASKPDPQLGQVIASGFAAQPGDSPELVGVGQDGSFAVVALGKVIPATPQPLATVKAQVTKDFLADRADQAAHKAAQAIVDAVNKGTALKQAITDAKVPVQVQPIHLTRAQLAASQQGAPPPLALLFSTPAKQARLLEAPNNAGWLIVYTDSITRGDASSKPDVVKATQADLGHFVGNEYAQQFVQAVRNKIGVTKNDAAIEQVKQELLGNGGDAQP